jgi:hypothetical protein
MLLIEIADAGIAITTGKSGDVEHIRFGRHCFHRRGDVVIDKLMPDVSINGYRARGPEHHMSD